MPNLTKTSGNTLCIVHIKNKTKTAEPIISNTNFNIYYFLVNPLSIQAKAKIAAIQIILFPMVLANSILAARSLSLIDCSCSHSRWSFSRSVISGQLISS